VWLNVNILMASPLFYARLKLIASKVTRALKRQFHVSIGGQKCYEQNGEEVVKLFFKEDLLPEEEESLFAPARVPLHGRPHHRHHHHHHRHHHRREERQKSGANTTCRTPRRSTWPMMMTPTRRETPLSSEASIPSLALSPRKLTLHISPTFRRSSEPGADLAAGLECKKKEEMGALHALDWT